jgi:hypothetical protein
VLNLASNNLGELVLAAGWRSKDNDGCNPWVGPEGQEQREKPVKPEGIIAIANAIPDMGALSILILKDNRLATRDGGKALASALAGNLVLTALDVSSNAWYSSEGDKSDGPGFVQELAIGVKDSHALKSLNLSQNGLLNKESGHALALALLDNSALTDLDFSKNFDLTNDSSQDGSGFAESFAYCLKTNKSLNTVDISNNEIPFTDDLVTSMCAIRKVLTKGNNYLSIENPCLKVLCEEKVLEAESIGKIDLHSQKLTGELLRSF